jgi:uncharacterized protein (TIGR00288 family)
MISTETRSRIAVFIDFDNVEIGVKSTLNSPFDIGLVLEAIKERGEIVTKIAYSDWKRAGDYSRLLTQHAIRMVQRNFTPGGDKNGADITMALDALEMAFTHDHINAFVIVGGDSDFISLVEKLKQYGRRVIVVGGRQFTSLTMQRNCHEFIAYENLVGASRPARAERGTKPAASAHQSDIAKVLPLVKRALKVLSEREVTPQLGLLKSTLLQLDSTFSEREYGAGSFRDFMEKVAKAGAVTLKHSGRSLLVEPVEDGLSPVESASPAVEKPVDVERPADVERPVDDDEEMPVSELGNADGVRAVQQAFSSGTPRWPMYIRQAKQFLKGAIENFDERRYGFASVVDLLRAAAKTGVVRIERDRQGGMRVFPGAILKAAAAPASEAAQPETVDVTDVAAEATPDFFAEPVIDIAAERPIVDAEISEPQPAADVEAIDVTNVTDVSTPKTRRRGGKARAPRVAKAREPKAAKAAAPRARKSSRPKSAEAADNRS